MNVVWFKLLLQVWMTSYKSLLCFEIFRHCFSRFTSLLASLWWTIGKWIQWQETPCSIQHALSSLPVNRHVQFPWPSFSTTRQLTPAPSQRADSLISQLFVTIDATAGETSLSPALSTSSRSIVRPAPADLPFTWRNPLIACYYM